MIAHALNAPGALVAHGLNPNNDPFPTPPGAIDLVIEVSIEIDEGVEASITIEDKVVAK